MKLITEYSYPAGNKLKSAYYTYPWVDKDDISCLSEMFYREALPHFDKDGFRMSIRLVEQEGG